MHDVVVFQIENQGPTVSTPFCPCKSRLQKSMAPPGQWETTFGAQYAMISSIAPSTMLQDFYGIFCKNL